MALKIPDEIYRELGLEPPKRSKQGFGSMSAEEVRKHGREGGKKAHAEKKAHRFTKEEASAAGKKGMANRWARWRAERALSEQTLLDKLRQRLGGSEVEMDRDLDRELRSIHKQTHRDIEEAMRRLKQVSSKSEILEKMAKVRREPSIEAPAEDPRVQAIRESFELPSIEKQKEIARQSKEKSESPKSKLSAEIEARIAASQAELDRDLEEFQARKRRR